jgi:hypothetical protein
MSTPPFTFSRVTLAGPLWTVAELKAIQLRITDAAHDDDVEQKIDAAQEYVLAYLGPAGDPTWTPTTAPKMVKHAIAMLTVYLYEHRGDDTPVSDGNIWATLAHLLGSYRDIAIA